MSLLESLSSSLSAPLTAEQLEQLKELKQVKMARDSIVSARDLGGEEESTFSYSLRPRRFADYIGQEKLLKKLRIAVKAAKSRKEPVEHILLHGPPGLGKTTP